VNASLPQIHRLETCHEAAHRQFVAGLEAPVRAGRRAWDADADRRAASDPVTFVALHAQDGQDAVVGESRYRTDGSATMACFSIAVARAWRGTGLADEMLALLAAHAMSASVERLCAEIPLGDARLRAFVRRHGFIECASPTARTVHVEKRLRLRHYEGATALRQLKLLAHCAGVGALAASPSAFGAAAMLA